MSVVKRYGSLKAAMLVGVVAIVLGIGSAAEASSGELTRVCPDGPPMCGFTSIQEAIAAAEAGSTVIVEAGEYAGPVQISKSVTLIGDAQGRSVINQGVIVAGPFPVTLRGFTITKGLNGIQAQSPPGRPAKLSPALQVENVQLSGNAQNGIALFDRTQARLSNVTIAQNGTSVQGNPIGGGIAVRDQAHVVLRDRVRIRKNGANGVALLGEATAAMGAGTLIAQNGLNGVQLGGSSQATLEGITSRQNRCLGVAVNDRSQATIRDGQLMANGKAGLQVGGPSSMIAAGCATLSDVDAQAQATVAGTTIASNPIGILVGDRSKELDRAELDATLVLFNENGCDLLVDPVASKDVTMEQTSLTPCS